MKASIEQNGSFRKGELVYQVLRKNGGEFFFAYDFLMRLRKITDRSSEVRLMLTRALRR